MKKFDAMNGITIKPLRLLTFDVLDRTIDEIQGTMLGSIMACTISKKKELWNDLIFLSYCSESPIGVMFKSCSLIDRTDYQSFQLRRSLIKDRNKPVYVEIKDQKFHVIGVHLSRHENSKTTGHYGTKILPSIVFEIVPS